MKSVLIPLSLAAAALTGCVGYGDTPVYGNSGWPAQSGYYGGNPAVYGGSGYYGNSGYYNGGTTVYTQPYSQGYTQPYIVDGTRTTRRDRDRDGDGIPNRMDPDRDGDGVPNQYDNYPRDPNRR